jgi:SAM-dependent methyltransferase
MIANSAADFSNHTCTAPAERSDRMRDIVVAHVPQRRAGRILDLGCGTGSLVMRLADAFPDASLTGIDISAANIRAARDQAAAVGRANRIRFENGDYLAYTTEPFDAIVADGVLHLIPGDTDRLLKKIAGDLRDGGVFVCSMPFDCLYNRIFAIVRRSLRMIRSAPVDRLIIGAARLVHRGGMDDAAMRERVQYMYLPPIRVMGEHLASQFAAAGLSRTAEAPMPSTSPSQLKHSVTIWTRRGTGG